MLSVLLLVTLSGTIGIFGDTLTSHFPDSITYMFQSCNHLIFYVRHSKIRILILSTNDLLRKLEINFEALSSNYNFIFPAMTFINFST